MIIEKVFASERMLTSIAHIGLSVVCGSIANQTRHISYADIMSFVCSVLTQQQQVYMMQSPALGAAVFYTKVTFVE